MKMLRIRFTDSLVAILFHLLTINNKTRLLTLKNFSPTILFLQPMEQLGQKDLAISEH